MAACPPLQNSQIFNPPSIANDDGITWNDQLNLIDFNDLIPNTDCLKEPARGIFWLNFTFYFNQGYAVGKAVARPFGFEIDFVRNRFSGSAARSFVIIL